VKTNLVRHKKIHLCNQVYKLE